jgi:hypothetical protein
MKKDLVHSLGWGVGIILLALAASWARRSGMVDDEATKRIVLCATGLMVAAFGNRMPKAFATTATAQQVQRVGGWSLAISGLVYAGLWAFAPFDVAIWGGCAAIIIGILVTAVYCWRARSQLSAQ